jgi:trimethylamine--corrinoid protein Co-methyltransferase
MLRGIPVDAESLALEAIADVGPGGDYLTAEHTRRHMRELWQPKYLDRRPWSQYETDPDKPHREALERARTLLRDHRPEPLDPALDRELTQIVEAHARGAGSSPVAVG